MARTSAFWRSYRPIYTHTAPTPTAAETIRELDEADARAIAEARACLADRSRSMVAHRLAAARLAAMGVRHG